MTTVVVEDSTVGTLYQLLLCPNTPHVIQEDFPRSNAKVGTNKKTTIHMYIYSNIFFGKMQYGGWSPWKGQPPKQVYVYMKV